MLRYLFNTTDIPMTHTLKLSLRQIFHTPTLLLLAILVFVPISTHAQFYYEDDYYAFEDGYCAYESNVQDAFAASNPTPSSPRAISGRQNAWGEGYTEDELHPGDPLPIGDHTILFVFAAITAMVVFFQRRKRSKFATDKTPHTLVFLAFICLPIFTFAQSNGDLRIQYVEQKVETYEDPSTHQQKTRIVRTYTHESDIIPARAAGSTSIMSVHIYNKIEGTKEYTNNPEVILQQYDGSKWVDKECHMVFGPLRGLAGAGLLPGRKNAAPGSDIDDFLYGDGIEKIKYDLTYKDKGFKASGVWNFVVKHNGSNPTFDMTQVHRYEGSYYVRVNGDNDYKNATDLITLSDYAFNNYGVTIGALKVHDYTHYACKTLAQNSNVKFTIANDYSRQLAKELLINNERFSDDTYTSDIYATNSSGQPTLSTAASVRFSWDIFTNRLTRLYVGDAKTPSGEYLVAHGNGQTPEARHHFQDNTNWMYSVDVTSKKGTPIVVRAKYNNNNQFFWGTGESAGSPLIADDGSGDDKSYPIRIIYDLKDHRLVTIYKPDASTDGEVNLNTPVMLHRVHNDPATQFIFPSNADKAVANGDTSDDPYTNPVYAVLSFLEDKFATNVSGISHYEKMFYWVSFPFDVKIQDIFGLGEYENYWIIQYYDGAKRALNGLPYGTTAWDYMPADGTLEANVGYIVCLDYKKLSTDYGYTSGGGRKVSLYFPSANRVNTADIHHKGNLTVNLEEYTKGDKVAWNHWNWHLLGVPSFANTTQTDIPFYYQYDHAYDGYGPAACTGASFFSPMHAYMVQYAGDVNWTGVVNITPKSVAAEQSQDSPIMLRLELQQANQALDKTFIQLRSDKGTSGFDINLDLTKIINKGANIYSVVNGDQMAGNAVPKEESIIPLGVMITKAGKYTFAMPEGTSGTQVELIDYETGISTPLAALDYTVNMPAGSFDNRFSLSIKPDKVTTGVDNLGDEATGDKAKKYLIDGALYLVKDGVLYDVQGKLVR